MCEDHEICDPQNGRSASDPEVEKDPPLQGTPGLSDRLTVLAFGKTQARTILRNDSPEPLAYRLAAANPALTLDTEPTELQPGDQVELVVDVDLTALAPTDRVLPVQIITSGGAILWSLQIDALPEAGSFRGMQ